MPHLALWYWISDNRSRPSSITVRAMDIFELIMGHADDSKYATLLDEALIALERWWSATSGIQS